MDMKELQKKDDAALKQLINEKRESLRTLRFSAAGSGMRDVKSIQNTKRELAQALTELNRRANESQT